MEDPANPAQSKRWVDAQKLISCPHLSLCVSEQSRRLSGTLGATEITLCLGVQLL